MHMFVLCEHVFLVFNCVLKTLPVYYFAVRLFCIAIFCVLSLTDAALSALQ